MARRTGHFHLPTHSPNWMADFTGITGLAGVSERVATTARFIANAIRAVPRDLETWRSCRRRFARPIRQWRWHQGCAVHRSFLAGSAVRGARRYMGAKICPRMVWRHRFRGEDMPMGRGAMGQVGGYCNAYLFAYYRELHGPTLHDPGAVFRRIRSSLRCHAV